MLNPDQVTTGYERLSCNLSASRVRELFPWHLMGFGSDCGTYFYGGFLDDDYPLELPVLQFPTKKRLRVSDGAYEKIESARVSHYKCGHPTKKRLRVL